MFLIGSRGLKSNNNQIYFSVGGVHCINWNSPMYMQACMAIIN